MAKRKSEKTLKEEEKRKFNKKNLAKLKGVFEYIRPYKTAFYLGSLCLVLSSITLLSFPYLLGKLVDVANGETNWHLKDINSIALVLGGILLLQSFFSFFRVTLYAKVVERAMADLRTGLYQKIITLPMQFYDSARVGELVSRLTTDIVLLQETFSTSLAELIRQLLTLLVGLSILFVIAPKLTFFMLAIIPMVAIVGVIFGKKIKKRSKVTQDKLALANIIVEETFHAIATVKSFTNEWLEINKYKKSVNTAVTSSLKTAKFRGLFISFIIFVIFGGLVSVIWFGARLVSLKEMTSGDLFSFVLFTGFIGGSIAGLSDIMSQIQKAIGASERVLDIMTKSNSELLTTEDSLGFVSNLRFDSVGFTYPSRPESKVLHNLSLTINKGERIALVGHSGAGKSTIAQILLRFYEQNEGSITLDGQEVHQFPLSSYRKLFGVVPQEVLLFGGTIAENIGYGNPSASLEAIKLAAEKANAMEFIAQFPEGFDTLVGERGTGLSGGQKQRIAIARAILKDPEILILDEATSALDAQSEALVQDALDNLMEGRTTVIIAHRLSTIRKADAIVVLEKGEIAETGTHQDLLINKEGIYSNLIKLQYEEAEP